MMNWAVKCLLVLVCLGSMTLASCEEAGDASCEVTCPDPPDADLCDGGVGPGEGDEEALRRVMAARRSVRQWSRNAISREDIEALMWAAQGVTAPDMPTGVPDIVGYRTSPSAGATYPLELYVITNNVAGMEQSVYWYHPMRALTADGEFLEEVGPAGSMASEFGAACVGQEWVARAQANIVITADYERTRARYGTRGDTYVTLEAGHAAQNIMLMAVARGLGTVPIGSFGGDVVHELLGLPEEHSVVYVVAVGDPMRDE